MLEQKTKYSHIAATTGLKESAISRHHKRHQSRIVPATGESEWLVELRRWLARAEKQNVDCALQRDSRGQQAAIKLGFQGTELGMKRLGMKRSGELTPTQQNLAVANVINNHVLSIEQLDEILRWRPEPKAIEGKVVQ
jgi:hypothetical protein